MTPCVRAGHLIRVISGAAVAARPRPAGDDMGLLSAETPVLAPVLSNVPAVLASVTSTANAGCDNCGGTGNAGGVIPLVPAPRAARGLEHKQTRDRPPTRNGGRLRLLRRIRRLAESVEYFS